MWRLKMLFAKKTLSTAFVWISLFFVNYASILAKEVIDIDVFSFPSTQTKGVRVVAFDTDAQRFTGIHYFVQPTKTVIRCSLWGMKFDSEGNVDLTKQFKLKDRILTTKGTLKVEGEDATDVAVADEDASEGDEWVLKSLSDFHNNGSEVTRLVLSLKKVEIKSGAHIMASMNTHAGKVQSKKTFQATFHRGENVETETFGNLTSVGVDNNNERGNLGELATKLTMIGFGYGGHFSKYGTDNGFDGIFTDISGNPEMFITESKCRERADGVKTIMRDNLSEEKINFKLKRISTHTHPSLSDEARERLVATGELVREFISQSPVKIFKFAHRIKSDGTCECLVEKFDLSKYQASLLPTLSPESPTKDKVTALKGVTQQLCSSEDQKAELYMRTLVGTQEDKLRLVFGALKLDDEQQEAMLAVLAPKKKVNRVLFINTDGDSVGNGEEASGTESAEEFEKEDEYAHDSDAEAA